MTCNENMTCHELIKVFADISDPKEMETFFQELFTPREIEDFYLRWELMKDLFRGEPQRKIADKHKISLCKITRGSKVLKEHNSIILKLLRKYCRRN
jgi:TrpR family trp operon transcriptional repressor